VSNTSHEQTTIDSKWAWDTVCEFVEDEGLRRHMQAVGAAMSFYAQRLDADPEYWRTVGILHDFDWEIHPDLDGHPMKGAPILRERGVDEETIRIILSHATEGSGVVREKAVDFALYACDDITGLLTAVTLVRPSRDIREVKLKSVRKKWKDKRFAGGVDRDHVTEAVAEFSEACFGGQLDLWQHIANVLEAMQAEAEELGLDGRLAAA